MKPITIGRDFGNAVEVLEGIEVADRVVINPPDSLQPGEQVTVTPRPGETPTGAGQPQAPRR
jgi:hypothetical protein